MLKLNVEGLGPGRPATARGDGAYKVGGRYAIVESVHEPPLIPAVLQGGGEGADERREHRDGPRLDRLLERVTDARDTRDTLVCVPVVRNVL